MTPTRIRPFGLLLAHGWGEPLQFAPIEGVDPLGQDEIAGAIEEIANELSARLEVFIRRDDADRFIEQVRGDDPEVAAKLRIEERELEAGGLN